MGVSSCDPTATWSNNMRACVDAGGGPVWTTQHNECSSKSLSFSGRNGCALLTPVKSADKSQLLIPETPESALISLTATIVVPVPSNRKFFTFTWVRLYSNMNNNAFSPFFTYLSCNNDLHIRMLFQHLAPIDVSPPPPPQSFVTDLPICWQSAKQRPISFGSSL